VSRRSGLVLFSCWPTYRPAWVPMLCPHHISGRTKWRERQTHIHGRWPCRWNGWSPSSRLSCISCYIAAHCHGSLAYNLQIDDLHGVFRDHELVAARDGRPHGRIALRTLAHTQESGLSRQRDPALPTIVSIPCRLARTQELPGTALHAQ
jgi:hypothetical protein